MILKKSLKRAQATIEFLLIFTAVAAYCLLSKNLSCSAYFFPRARAAAQGTAATPGYAQKAFDAIINADQR